MSQLDIDATKSVKTDILAGYVEKPELAREFEVSERTVDRWCNQPNGLPHVKVGRRTYFSIESVKKWLGSRETQRNKRKGPRTA